MDRRDFLKTVSGAGALTVAGVGVEAGPLIPELPQVWVTDIAIGEPMTLRELQNLREKMS